MDLISVSLHHLLVPDQGLVTLNTHAYVQQLRSTEADQNLVEQEKLVEKQLRKRQVHDSLFLKEKTVELHINSNYVNYMDLISVSLHHLLVPDQGLVTLNTGTSSVKPVLCDHPRKH
jgi:hypothetical protein